MVSGKSCIKAAPIRRNFVIGYIDSGSKAFNVASMDLEELFPSKPGDPLTQLMRQDLDPLSVEELHARISALEGEIARVRGKIEASVNHRASAEALFRK